MATQLLNDDGSASMATIIMTSHHAYRRDLAAFGRVLASVDGADTARLQALRDEWTSFRASLHGHHVIEDTAIFPDLRSRFPDLGHAIDELDGQHRAIDPLLERGDRAFAQVPAALGEAREVVATIDALLATHLDAEEAAIIPHLRNAKQFPQPPENAIAQYADGFAWSTAGLANEVVERVHAMLPAALVALLPAARQAFDARCVRVWGKAHAGSSRTSVPA